MDISEQEAGEELRQHGLESAWGCKGGVFMSSADAFKLIKLIKMLRIWVKPETQRLSFNEVRQILIDSVGVAKKITTESSDDESGKGAYKNNGVSQLDLG